jgi:hypothetical protein
MLKGLRDDATSRAHFPNKTTVLNSLDGGAQQAAKYALDADLIGR